MVRKKLKVCPYETVVTLEFTISKENPLQILSPKTQVSNTLHLEPVQKKRWVFPRCIISDETFQGKDLWP